MRGTRSLEAGAMWLKAASRSVAFMALIVGAGSVDGALAQNDAQNGCVTRACKAWCGAGRRIYGDFTRDSYWRNYKCRSEYSYGGPSSGWRYEMDGFGGVRAYYWDRRSGRRSD